LQSGSLAGASDLPALHDDLDGLDVLVIGSGIAGLSAAVALSGKRRVAVISKEAGGGGSTELAQGGVAAVLGPPDSAEAHARDTVVASAGLGDAEVALAVTAEAKEAIQVLVDLGVRFDPGAPAREGGHSAARVVHARGDATGAEISRGLMEAARSQGLPVLAGMLLLDLVTEPVPAGGHRVVGALVSDQSSGIVRAVLAGTVILATGGYGHLWASTTSPPACSGDGLAAALRAGAQVADLEFVQFHPTGMALGRDPRPLASEALRGAGARLRDSAGELLHTVTEPGTGDLAPRDVVSASMARRMAELGADHCYLDATLLDPALLEGHFPTFVAACRAAGIEPSREWVPVSPTTHYTMGGVLTDADGRTTIEGLMAVGEVGCSGLHGANRLASNSLLEGAVVGRRAARAVLESHGPVAPREAVELDGVLGGGAGSGNGVPLGRENFREAMQAFAGVTRDVEGLVHLAGLLDNSPTGQAVGLGSGEVADRVVAEGELAERELANMLLVGRSVAALALRRRESRGAHRRVDFRESEPRWLVRQVAQLLPSGKLAVGEVPVVGLGAGVAPPRSETPDGASSAEVEGEAVEGPGVGRPRAAAAAL
jgi:L-aspartate oxidase